jgi:hypothetical protein
MTRPSDFQRIIISLFLVLLALVLAVSPLPMLLRSLGLLLLSYAAFGWGGITLAYLVALLVPPAGLLTGDPDWLVMLPLILSSGLLAMAGLEYAWRYPAILISPLLYIAPQLFVWLVSYQPLFAINLPWEPSARTWISLHGLAALFAMLLLIYLERFKERRGHQPVSARSGRQSRNP